MSPLIQDHAFNRTRDDTTRYESHQDFDKGALDLPTGPNDDGRSWVPKPLRKSFTKISQRLPTGWRLGTSGAALLTFLILIANISITAVCYSKIRSQGYNTSIAPISTGDCGSIKKLGVGIHLVINIISTLLLGASSYCMQSISAPTRVDVDKAHAKGSWVDIGIPSFRNLRYNSTFFVSTNNNMYQIYYADESFAHGAPFNETFFRDKHGYYSVVDPWKIQDQLLHTEIYQNLTNDECIESYAKTLIEDRGTLILVVDRPDNCSIFRDPNIHTFHYEDCGNTSATSLYDMTVYSVGIEPASEPYVSNWYYWICSQEAAYRRDGGDPAYNKPPAELCSDGAWKKQLGADPWLVSGGRVRYCLSETVSNQCHLNVAVNLLWVVVAFNAAKLVITIVMAASSLINQNPLVTTGDAAASFIESPDQSTRGMCLYSAREIIAATRTRKDQPAAAVIARAYHPQQQQRWSAAVSKRRWILASALTLLALTTILSLLAYASSMLSSHYSRGTLSSLWSFGLGAITPYTLIMTWAIPSTGATAAAVVGAVLVANLPQLLFSFLYLVLNGVVTSMAGAGEWAGYYGPGGGAKGEAKGLRVSFPQGSQRSTYFLALPYRVGVPLMAGSAVLHWLVSQSIFVAQVRTVWTYETDVKPEEEDEGEDTLTTCAYSPMAMILTCVVVVVLFAAVVGLGRRRLRGAMPLAGSCSLAIAAACHGPEGTSSLGVVGWGVVVGEGDGDGDGDGEEVGHCGFSNEEVEAPVVGRPYA
ncbi:uncharacterized protein LTHEOB_10424 [Lasiodiplodia theobromae]|uniref:uncharacterized protein n=1 Tax=Lasiodiplodia theobromae TaxID=45133 RepID=UPI0015C3BC92|nr:uncharacterized protein LTHEOB_10424 [Lasiodiplodia theobromae]KAF4539260.1 hypothetical protein LTHEOB_10424 [Lasiodiplodia theobromae]